MNEKNTYSYSYSAEETREIMRIRDKYTGSDKRDAKLEQLRRLDASVHNTASAVSIAVGIIGVLIFGLGLSCVLVWEDKLFAVGILDGIVGFAIMIFAYPSYKITAKKKREEITPLIIKLTDELMK